MWEEEGVGKPTDRVSTGGVDSVKLLVLTTQLHFGTSFALNRMELPQIFQVFAENPNLTLTTNWHPVWQPGPTCLMTSHQPWRSRGRSLTGVSWSVRAHLSGAVWRRGRGLGFSYFPPRCSRTPLCSPHGDDDSWRRPLRGLSLRRWPMRGLCKRRGFVPRRRWVDARHLPSGAVAEVEGGDSSRGGSGVSVTVIEILVICTVNVVSLLGSSFLVVSSYLVGSSD